MAFVPIATFLAGSLLTILLPLALLIALVVWYWRFSSRVPETTEGPGTSAPPPAAPTAPDPVPSVSESLPPEPGA
ncbi:MAG TPA: hypothetical protein VMA77_10530 [Solirubrobacteraceae bacterium]|nr:hypothetical protein [Solirubrobacteraceae bacterium]